MSNYETELHKLLASFAPAGGFGIPNIGGVRNDLFNQNQSGLRQAIGRDTQGLQMQGAGRSVSAAFAPGARTFQFSKQFHSDLIDLLVKHGQLAESQRQNLLGMLSPIAQERANRPSWYPTLLGGALGLGAQVAIPGIGNKLFGNPLEKLFSQGQGGGYHPQTNYQFPQFNLPTGQFGGGYGG